ncbi:MAG: DUF488 domain-containing protein [Candidatus Gastranaerophilales bacterium]|nr:DUF488 domain-containing protein [Candidatus Gastranaerophilales bacterium]
MASVFTIGYAAFNIDDFIDVLKSHKISHLIDVRSNPMSEYFQDYNSFNLEPKLKQHNIIYENLALEFGARQENNEFFSKSGFIDFEKFTQSEQFKNGLAKIEDGLKQDINFVLMCAEKDPINCHRSIMIAHAMQKNGIQVLHIMYDGQLQPQNEIDKKLLELYFPDRNQLNLFTQSLDEQELIEQAYKKQNEKIGYRLESA